MKKSLLIVTAQNLLIFVCDHLGIYIADQNKYSSQCTGNEKRAKFDVEKSKLACLPPSWFSNVLLISFITIPHLVFQKNLGTYLTQRERRRYFSMITFEELKILPKNIKKKN